MKKYTIAIITLCLGIFLSCGDSTGPSASSVSPSTLTVTFTGSTKSPKSICRVNASWTMCTDHGFSTYSLYRSTSPGIEEDPSSAQEIAVISAYNSTVYVDESVAWDTDYYYALKTTDTEGNGVWSNEASVTTPVLDAPTPSLLELEDASWAGIEMNWSICPETDFGSYRLYRSLQEDIRSDTSSAECISFKDWRLDTSYTDTTASSSSIYYYALLTTNISGLSSWSNEITVSTPDYVPTAVVSEIAVGSEPWDAVSLPSGDYVYVTDRGQDAVHIIRTSDNSLYGSVNVGGNPYGICTSPSGDRIYTANWGTGDVSVIRTSDNTVIKTVSVGNRPVDVCTVPSGAYLYVTCRDDNSVFVLRTSDYAVVDSIVVGTSPYRICSLPSGGYLYVSNFSSSDISVIRTSDNTVFQTVDQYTHPIGIVSGTSGEYVYASNYSNDIVAVVRTSDNSVVKTVNVGNGPWGLCSHPSGECIYAANSTDDTVSLIRTWDNTVALTVDVGGNPSSVCCTPEGDAVYVVNYQAGTVSVMQ